MIILPGSTPAATMIRAVAMLAAPEPIWAMRAFIYFLAYDLEGVDQPRQGHGGRSLLVIVPDRNLGFFAQGIQDVETLGLGKILQVNSPKAGRDQLDGFDDLIGVFGVQADGPGIHSAQIFEQDGFPLHDRDGRLRTDIPQSQNPGSVGNHGHHVAFVGMLEDLLRVGLDVPAGCGHARGIPDGKIVEIAHRSISSAEAIFPL